VAGPAAAVNVISGNNQSAATGTKLKSLLVVSVTDQYGDVIPGVSVAFSDGGVGGKFSHPTYTTNNGGQANTNYTTPPQAKVVHITATVSGLPAAAFTETVTSK
jgi:trimeric autotransporter adhesin